eukprot:scaffold6792_cov35-Tisochrysis_lutea.AAC.6
MSMKESSFFTSVGSHGGGHASSPFSRPILKARLLDILILTTRAAAPRWSVSQPRLPPYSLPPPASALLRLGST